MTCQDAAQVLSKWTKEWDTTPSQVELDITVRMVCVHNCIHYSALKYCCLIYTSRVIIKIHQVLIQQQYAHICNLNYSDQYSEHTGVYMDGYREEVGYVPY